jgi:hypothetical protein
LTAEPTLAFSFGTAPVMASVLGAWVSPIPMLNTVIWA